MSGPTLALLSVAALVLLVYAGMHVATVLIAVSVCGIWILRGDIVQAAKLLGLAATDAISDYEFGVIPMFVFMGLLVMRSEMGRDSFQIAHRALRNVPGGLGHATVGANAIFAAITGVSVASATVFTRLAVPEMIARGYDPRFAVGVVAGSSVLGMLIPPSVLMILFGVLTQTSIGDLFISGIAPGLLLAALYGLLIWGWTRWRPQAFGDGRDAPGDVMPLRMLAWRFVQIALLVALVIGGIYAGYFTATEAGAVGAGAALLVTIARRRLDWRSLWELLMETGNVTASLMVLIVAASVYTRFLAFAGLPSAAGTWLADAGFGMGALLAGYIVVLLVLGTLMDSASIMLITVPLVYPLMMRMGADPVWLGCVTVVAVEIGLLTPPFGLAVFVIKSTLDDPRISLNDIFIGALPFAACMLLTVGLLIAWPGLATGLVQLAR